MTPDVHLLTGAYATDALPADERADFERHLPECDACSQEVRELVATAARLAAASTVVAPPALKQRVLARAGTVRQLSPLGPAEASTPEPGGPPAPAPGRIPIPAPAPAAGPSRAHPWYRTPLAAAAAVLLVASLGLGGLAADRQRRLAEAEATARAVAAVTADPDRVENSAPVAAGGSATVVAADGAAVVATRDLPPLPEDRAYQLWVLGGDGIRSAGLLPVRDGVAQALVRDLGGDAEALAVSVEPAAGSTQPTTDPIVVLPLA